MRPDPHLALDRLRAALRTPLGEAQLCGEDLLVLLDELDRMERFRLELRNRAPGVEPVPAPEHLAFLARLRAELESTQPGQGRLSRRQLQGLLDGWERFLRMEPFLQHHPSCPAWRPEPRSRVVGSQLAPASVPCACGFALAYTGARPPPVLAENRAEARGPPATDTGATGLSTPQAAHAPRQTHSARRSG